MTTSTPPRRVLAVEVPALLGCAVRRVEGTRFETFGQPGRERLHVYDSDQCVAVFKAPHWHAAWWLPPEPLADATIQA